MQEIEDESMVVSGRTSSVARKQRAGSKFVGGYGQKTGSSDLLFLEGQLPIADGEVLDGAPVESQLEQCVANLQNVLTDYRLTLEDVLKITVYLTDLDDYEAMEAAYSDAFEQPVPTRTVVGVSELLGGARVQLDAVAAIE